MSLVYIIDRQGRSLGSCYEHEAIECGYTKVSESTYQTNY
jgi:hypothetical protein